MRSTNRRRKAPTRSPDSSRLDFGETARKLEVPVEKSGEYCLWIDRPHLAFVQLVLAEVPSGPLRELVEVAGLKRAARIFYSLEPVTVHYWFEVVYHGLGQ